MSVNVLATGESAVLVDFPAGVADSERGSPVSSAVLPFVRAAEDDPDRPAGIEDIIPAACTVLVGFRRSAVTQDAVTAWCSAIADRIEVEPDAHTPGSGSRTTARADPAVTVMVTYDGPDLDDVSAATGLSPDAVISAHTGTPWTVAFTGFAPGFGYLIGGDHRLDVPRRTTPRTAVPAGSVGLAGTFSGVYPRPSPGGWQLIGRTDTRLWQPERDPPALLRPGMTVRFEATNP